MGLLLRLRDEAPESLPAGGVPFSPWTDLTQSGETFLTNADTGVPNCDKDYLSAPHAQAPGSCFPAR